MSSKRGTPVNSKREGYAEEASSSSSSDSENSFSSSFSSSRSDGADAERGYPNCQSNGGDSGSTHAVRRRVPPTSGNGHRSASETEPDPYGVPKQKYRNGTNGRHRQRHDHHHFQDKHGKPGSSRCRVMSHLVMVCCRSYPTIAKHIPTILVVGCFIFWLLVQTSNIYDSVSRSTRPREALINERKKGRVKGQANPPPPPPPVGSTFSFWSDAVDGLIDIVNIPAKVFQQSRRGEGLPPGCVRSPWQVHNLQNCNDIHESDLYEVFTGQTQDDVGYVGAGYWRHVWLMDGPRGESVLKMMKIEHKVETRNFERHRRDAISMERLTASKHIVDIYAFCGNSVLTEYVGSDMHMVLYHAEEDRSTASKEKKGTRGDRKMLELALQVVQGVADLHQVPGGPIVHADIADKQFLVDAEGNVKLNDFNRCRFMGHKKSTKEPCTFRIPSAPGRHRSPEEYEDKELTEQVDTYSTANVLYGILTGMAPWADEPSSQVKRAVKHGLKPPIDKTFRIAGTASALLASLIDQAYEYDPADRITAPAMAEALRKALHELKV